MQGTLKLRMFESSSLSYDFYQLLQFSLMFHFLSQFQYLFSHLIAFSLFPDSKSFFGTCIAILPNLFQQIEWAKEINRLTKCRIASSCQLIFRILNLNLGRDIPVKEALKMAMRKAEKVRKSLGDAPAN